MGGERERVSGCIVWVQLQQQQPIIDFKSCWLEKKKKQKKINFYRLELIYLLLPPMLPILPMLPALPIQPISQTNFKASILKFFSISCFTIFFIHCKCLSGASEKGFWESRFRWAIQWSDTLVACIIHLRIQNYEFLEPGFRAYFVDTDFSDKL